MLRSHWVGLADIEWLCQHVPNFIGIQGGEHLSSLYRDSKDGDMRYHHRLTRICAKYGMIYQEADGTYKDDKWQELMDQQGAFVREYGPWLVLSQKNNIIRRQFYSQSAAMGLWLGGDHAPARRVGRRRLLLAERRLQRPGRLRRRTHGRVANHAADLLDAELRHGHQPRLRHLQPRRPDADGQQQADRPRSRRGLAVGDLGRHGQDHRHVPAVRRAADPRRRPAPADSDEGGGAAERQARRLQRQARRRATTRPGRTTPSTARFTPRPTASARWATSTANSGSSSRTPAATTSSPCCRKATNRSAPDIRNLPVSQLQDVGRVRAASSTPPIRPGTRARRSSAASATR